MAAPTQDYPTKQSDDFGTIFGNTMRLISASWEAFKLNLVTFLVIYIAPLVVTAIAVYAAARTFFVGSGENMRLADNIQSEAVIAAGIAAIGIICILFITSIANIIVQLASVRGQKISISESINQSFPFAVRFLLLAILSVLIVVAGLVLLIIPGFVAMFFIFLASYILIDKDTTAVEALKESKNITQKNWKLLTALLLLHIGIQIISTITVIGQFAGEILTIMYLCLPAILYIRMQQQNPVKG